MARKKRQKQTIAQPSPLIERRKRFRLRYADGVVELGMGTLLLLLTLLNQSEYFFTDEAIVIWLLILQPILSLALFAGGLFLIRSVRIKVLEKRDDVQHVPLTKPMLWINLMILLLLIAAPLVWPVRHYEADVIAWVLGGLGCISGLIILILGVHHQFQRFMLIGGVIFVLAAVFTFVGQPGSLANQLVILVGVSGTFLISGGYALSQFMQGVDPYQ